ITGTTDEHMFRYTYDDQYRLNTANFGTFYNSTSTFTVSPYANYKEWGNSGASGINYDDNGNITNLKRNAYNGTLGLNMDDFSYTYTSNTNKLASIVDAIGANTYNDIEATTSKTFSYDNVGRLTTSQAESVTGITYTVRNKTNVVTFSNSNTSTYAYNDNNIKHKTKYFTNSNSKTKFNWFLTDEGGQIMAVYEYDQNAGTPTFGIIEEHLYAAGRLGVLNKTSGEIVYELTDHLGNVRASFKYIGSGNPQLVTRTDYYSFGGPMPGRSYNLGTYRFGFQGQESAVNQNWNNFELRMYNSDLGRFCNPDPMGQFASAYVGMGNNPISGYDPTGGYVNGGTGGDWQATMGRIQRQDDDDRFYRRGKYSFEARRKAYADAVEDAYDKQYHRGAYKYMEGRVEKSKASFFEDIELLKIQFHDVVFGPLLEADDPSLFGHGRGGTDWMSNFESTMNRLENSALTAQAVHESLLFEAAGLNKNVDLSDLYDANGRLKTGGEGDVAEMEYNRWAKEERVRQLPGGYYDQMKELAAQNAYEGGSELVAGPYSPPPPDHFVQSSGFGPGSPDNIPYIINRDTKISLEVHSATDRVLITDPSTGGVLKELNPSGGNFTNFQMKSYFDANRLVGNLGVNIQVVAGPNSTLYDLYIYGGSRPPEIRRTVEFRFFPD
ncbi:MAG: hypothetical protein HYU69_09530, partial [Bacteroidetes bacterium]|nr:hypothetical protein [Bacteroidota bacterium]